MRPDGTEVEATNEVSADKARSRYAAALVKAGYRYACVSTGTRHLNGESLSAVLSNELLIYAMLEPPREPSAPRETAINGEPGAVAEVENVEVAFLGLVFDEWRAGQRGLEVAEDHGSLADGEDTELR